MRYNILQLHAVYGILKASRESGFLFANRGPSFCVNRVP
jgi:hypothetical protein